MRSEALHVLVATQHVAIVELVQRIGIVARFKRWGEWSGLGGSTIDHTKKKFPQLFVYLNVPLRNRLLTFG